MSITRKNVLGILAALALGLPALAYGTTVSVTTGTQYQVIQGFGASSYSESISTAECASFFTDQSNAALGSQNGNSIGLSILRLSIDEGGAFGTEGNDAKNGVAVNPNLEVFASSWSPPAADKNDNSVDGPGSSPSGNSNFNPSGSNTPSNLPAFATFQAGFAQTMKNTYGVNLYAISPQNEPDYNTSYDSCLWTPAQFDTYIPELAADLKTDGMSSVKIMMPESFADNLAGSATTMGDPNAAPDVSIIGMHLYGGGPNAVPASYSTEAGHNVQSWVTEISEHSGSGTPWSDTLYYAQQIHKCIVDTDFNAYCYWWLVNLNSDDEGLYTSGAQPTSTYYMMGNWAKFIRPGYMRVSCTEDPQTNVQVSAYTGTATENGTTVNRVVIVAINAGTGSVSQAFNYTDQTVTETYPWITDASDNLVQQSEQPVSGGQFTYTLPASSITTFVADCGSSTTPTDSPTFTKTDTPTFTLTTSPTFTRSATASPSSSATPTRSSTASLTATESGTATPTLSSTLSASPSRTGTPTPSSTLTGSVSPTPSPTASKSPTASPTLSPTLSTSPSLTSSATATWTATFTTLPSGSPTATATLSGSPTQTATASPSPTDTGSPSGTPSGTVTSSPLPSASATLSATETVSGTPSPSGTPSLTGTPSPTLSPSESATVTATLSRTGSPSGSPSATETYTTGSGPTDTPSATATVRAATVTAEAPGGPLIIQKLAAVPNPDPRYLDVDLSGSADRVVLTVYSLALVQVGRAETGPLTAGWTSLPVGGLFDRLAPGLYYVEAEAWRGGAHSAAVVTKVFLLRP